MGGGNAIRGTRVGGGPVRWSERSEQVPRRIFHYFCANGHVTELTFAMGVDAPATWDCPHCGGPAGQDEHNPPPARRAEPYKSHLAYVKERRSDEDGEAILAEALAALRQRRR